MKLRRIAAALVIVSLGAASFTFAAVRGQMADCRITEKTIVGDAAAAAGLSASFGMGLQNQLYWRNVYTYGGADDGADVQETAFSRKNPFPADKKGPVPYVRLENFTASGDVIYSLLPGAKGYSYRQERLSAVRQDFLQPDAVEKLQTIEQQLPEEGRDDIKLREIFRYYPIDGDLRGKTLIYSVSLTDVSFGTMDVQTHWENFNHFFRIPVLENESSGFWVQKYPEGFMRTDYYEGKERQSAASDHFDFYSIACSTPDAVYFTFNTHTDDGDVVDTSLIPGGYGIYRLPYDREKEIFRSEKLEMVYALDPKKQYTDIYASPDGAKLFLVSQAARLTAVGVKEVQATAEIIDVRTMQCDRREEIVCSADAALGYDAGDYLIFRGRSELCLYTYQDGSYKKELMLTDVPFRLAAIRNLFYDNRCRTAYDGKRLSILGEADFDIEDEDNTMWLWETAGTVEVAVLDSSGLAYYGTLRSNMQDFCDVEEYRAWEENVKPRDGKAKTYAHSSTNALTSYLDKVIWLGI